MATNYTPTPDGLRWAYIDAYENWETFTDSREADKGSEFSRAIAKIEADAIRQMVTAWREDPDRYDFLNYDTEADVRNAMTDYAARIETEAGL
mgnify:CR=1 FL=1